MNSIELKGLYASIDDFKLKDINLVIEQGTIIGVLGKNGAGKSTLFKTILGTYLKDKGELYINNKTYETDELNIRRELVLIHDTNNLNPYTKGKRLLKYHKAYFPDFDETYLKQQAEKMNVSLNTRIQKLSLGMQKKLLLLMGLARKPKVLLLDEPFIGIDPIDKKHMVREIQTYMEDETNTVIISSHYVEDLEKIADYIAIIDQGELKLFQDKESLLSSYVLISLEKDNPLKEGLLYPFESFDEITGLMLKAEATRANLTYQIPTLEDIFIQISQSEDLSCDI